MALLAQTQDSISNPALSGNLDLGKLVAGVFSLLTFLGAVLLFLYLVLGGIMWITAGGDAKKTESAGKQITNALIGFTLLAIGWAIAAVFGSILGIDILNEGIKIPTWF